jgi:hypothetical protein
MGVGWLDRALAKALSGFLAVGGMMRKSFSINKFDGFVESPFGLIFVIPAKAGIQLIQVILDSCFRRSDGFPDFLRDHQI